mgnify:CR=1 FL=1
MAVTKEQLSTMAEMGNNSLDGTSVHELALEAQDAIDDTDLKAGEFTHTPTADDPYAMIVEEASSAGKSVVYDIRNGEASIVNNNMLPTQLGKTDPETGKRIFTTRQSDAPPVSRGEYLCLLHENHSDREYHKSLGLGTCNKSNLRTMLDVRTHAQNRHRAEWAAITEARDQEREDQERKIRELTLSQLMLQHPKCLLRFGRPPLERVLSANGQIAHQKADRVRQRTTYIKRLTLRGLLSQS